MIPDDRIRRAQELIAAGLNNAQVASRTGMDRKTVAQIRKGNRLPGVPSNHEREPYNEIVPKGPVTRCPTCGGLMQGVCIVCATRKNQTPSVCDGEDDDDLSLRLEGEALARYERMRLHRMDRRATKHDMPTGRPTYRVEVIEPRHHGYGADDDDG